MTKFSRTPLHRYHDPLALVWLACAERVGFRIVRSPDVYASYDGRGTIIIGNDDILDPDDCLAQMILHELCHALIEGDAGESSRDWGLDNTSGRHTWREQACLRLQAYLSASVGLRAFLAPTTDFRVSFWSTLGDDPFWASAEAGGRRDRSCVAARLGAWRALQARWQTPLRQALQASGEIAAALGILVAGQAEAAPTTRVRDELPSLWQTAAAVPPIHSAGHSFIAGYRRNDTCRECSWSYQLRGSLRCRHASGIKLADDCKACARWEPSVDLDCQACGACCREAYHAVEISAREPLVRRHFSLVVEESGRRKLLRRGNRCAALDGGTIATAPYFCSIYEDRPRTCKDFTRGGKNCLDARQRVGLSL